MVVLGLMEPCTVPTWRMKNTFLSSIVKISGFREYYLAENKSLISSQSTEMRQGNVNVQISECVSDMIVSRFRASLRLSFAGGSCWNI